MSNWRNPRALRILSGVLALAFVTASALAFTWQLPAGALESEQSLGAFVRERGLSNYRMPVAYMREKLENVRHRASQNDASMDCFCVDDSCAYSNKTNLFRLQAIENTSRVKFVFQSLQ